ncbi:MAG TPA: hypothetical protein IAB01_04490 [Candidatus Avidesulfovibrio excrementigallinarum]|nr:hypothetical protein [Candidatus Avidesulfovibrio excrementigallinarum]
MEDLVTDLFGSYAGLVLSVMGVCAAVAALLPAPAQDGSAVYRLVYKALNLLAANVGHATNADDAAQKQAA